MGNSLRMRNFRDGTPAIVRARDLRGDVYPLQLGLKPWKDFKEIADPISEPTAPVRPTEIVKITAVAPAQ